MSTSKLQKLVKKELYKYFFDKSIFENYRPNWLLSNDGARLELDFFIEKLDVAIEVQGDQHFVYSEFFHGTPDNFRIQKERDKKKREICKARNILLIEVISEEQIEHVIRLIGDLGYKEGTLKRFLKRKKYDEFTRIF